MINEKWDIRFMRIAREVSTWSKDPSSKIGAVIVNDDKRILATGYNGFPRGVADSSDRLSDRDQKLPMIIHAELNALLNALNNGVSVKDSTLYVYGLPVCSNCAKSVVQAGIKTIAVSVPYDNRKSSWFEEWERISLPMFLETGISLKWIKTRDL